MKRILITVVIIGCFCTSSIAFAEIISLGHASFEPTIMLILGFGLLGLAGIGRRNV